MSHIATPQFTSADDEVSFIPRRALAGHPATSTRPYYDTMDDGWEEGALDALLNAEDALIFDWPARRWVMLRAARFCHVPVLPQMRRVLRAEYGIVRRRVGRRA